MDDDEFDFSDDDLDALPANALQNLEVNAFRATQHQQYATADSNYGLDDGEEVVNLDDDDDDGIVMLEDESAMLHHADPEQHYNYDHVPPGRDDSGYQRQSAAEPAPSRSPADPTQLLLRIKKLEQEKARERRQAEELRGKLQTKSGEADTLRRRQDADGRRYERMLVEQQNAHSAEAAKLKAELEKLRREKESAQTDNLFNQHEAREAVLTRRTVKAVPTRPKAVGPTILSPAGTPKRGQKQKGMLGDGFDDDDVVMASPSKRDRLKMATPKQAGKRKRQILDQSPIPLPELQLSEPRSRPAHKDVEAPSETTIDAAILQHFQPDDRRFELLHSFLTYPSSNGTDRVFEALTQHAFPSDASQKLSSLVYDALAAATPVNAHHLAVRICDIFLDLWKRCLHEKYYAPFYLILDAIQYILACEPSDTAANISTRAVPLIIASIDLVADPIAKAAKGGEQAIANLYSTAQREIASHIDVLECLQLMHVIAIGCVSCTDGDKIIHLWQTIPSTFACMLLIKEQPLPQIMLMLHILSTSALESSLGPATSPGLPYDNQISNQDALINRLTNLFTEVPHPVSDPSQTSEQQACLPQEDLWNLRLLVLSVLTQFASFQHGSASLAQNRACIGRLVKYLDYCISSLYHNPLSPTQPQKVESINTTMKLVYHIATTSGGFDMKSKLTNTLGGQHAYLVALTRLAFSEGVVLEAGIEDAVVNMAHDILDEGLSPEEGDAFGRVFNSSNTT